MSAVTCNPGIMRFVGLALLAVSSCARPIPRFTWTGEQTAPARIQFDNQSEKAETFSWDFGDGNLSTDTLPAHRFVLSGRYPVSLSVRLKNKTRTLTQMIDIKAPEKCLVEIETEFGTMLAELYNDTPLHQENFLKLAKEGFFNDLLFHRVIDGFMIQGGDPDSKNAKPGQSLGMGGPGYTVPAEFVAERIHVKGALAAARTQNPEKRSSGSQFYIVQGSPLTPEQLDMMEARKGIRYGMPQREAYLELGGTPFLDGEYTVFGQVVEGLEVIDRITAAETDPRDRPVSDIKMKIRVIQ